MAATEQRPSTTPEGNPPSQETPTESPQGQPPAPVPATSSTQECPVSADVFTSQRNPEPPQQTQQPSQESVQSPHRISSSSQGNPSSSHCPAPQRSSPEPKEAATFSQGKLSSADVPPVSQAVPSSTPGLPVVLERRLAATPVSTSSGVIASQGSPRDLPASNSTAPVSDSAPAVTATSMKHSVVASSAPADVTHSLTPPTTQSKVEVSQSRTEAPRTSAETTSAPPRLVPSAGGITGVPSIGLSMGGLRVPTSVVTPAELAFGIPAARALGFPAAVLGFPAALAAASSLTPQVHSQTAFSQQQMMLLMEKEKQRFDSHNPRLACTAASVSTSAGTYSMSISRGPLVPSGVGVGVKPAPPRTPSVPPRTASSGGRGSVGGSRTGSGSISRTPSDTSPARSSSAGRSAIMGARTPSGHSHHSPSPSRPASAHSRQGSRPPSALHSTPPGDRHASPLPQGLYPSTKAAAPGIPLSSPRAAPGSITHGIPVPSGAAGVSPRQMPSGQKASTNEAPLDLSKSNDSSSSVCGDRPLDLTSSSRKRTSEDSSNNSDDDVICVGESRRPPPRPSVMATSHRVGKYPRLSAVPPVLGSSLYEQASQYYRTNHSMAHHHPHHQRPSATSSATPPRERMVAPAATQYSGLYRPVPSHEQGSIFDLYMRSAQAGTPFPSRPVSPRGAATSTPARSLSHHSSATGRDAASSSRGSSVIRAPPTSTITSQQKLHLSQKALDIHKMAAVVEQQRRALYNAKHMMSQRTPPSSVAAPGHKSVTSTTGKPVSGDGRPKEHSIPSGRVLMMGAEGKPASAHRPPLTPPVTTPKDRVSYMLAQEPVPAACAANSVSAIQITQQPTYLAASPLLVPSPASGKLLSRFMAAPGSASQGSTSNGANAPPPQADSSAEVKVELRATGQSGNGDTAPPRFINTDTQTADLPGDQWRRGPFHRIGVPNKNIPVANVNPMVHHHPQPHPSTHTHTSQVGGTQQGGAASGSGSHAPIAVHPKKQILFQQQNRALNQRHTEVQADTASGAGVDPAQGSVQLKPEFSSSRDVKLDVAGRERYLGNIKERVIQRVEHTQVKDEGQGVQKGDDIMKRKFHREHSLLRKSHHGHGGHYKPLLSKTVLDLSDITGESAPAHAAPVTPPDDVTTPRDAQAHLKRRSAFPPDDQKCDPVKRVLKDTNRSEEATQEQYAGDTEVEDEDSNHSSADSESSSSDYKPPTLSRAERFQARIKTRSKQTLSSRAASRPFHRVKGKTGRRRNNSLYNKNAAYERELRKDEFRRLLSRYRRQSHSTRSSPRSLRALPEVQNYNEADDLSDDLNDLDELDPKHNRVQLPRRRFLPKAKRSFFRGKHDGWGSLHNKRRRARRRGDGDDSDVSRTSSRFNEDSRDGLESRSAPAELRKLVVCKETGETLLHKAALLGNEDVVRYIVESRSIDVNARDNAGYTALHETCVRGHLRVARLLVMHGADVNAAALDGTRPIHDAVDNNHVELARLMLACGADMRIATYSGRTCVKLARSLEMQHLINGFVSDLNEAEETVPWEFYGSTCTDASNKESGCDVFASVPSDDDEATSSHVTSSSALPDCDVLFEFSDTPILPVHTITLKEHEGPRHYYLLKSVLQRLHMGKKELLRLFPDLYIYSVTNAASQVKDARPSIARALSREKSFDIVKVTDTLDAALGYTREFLFPEHARRHVVDLPDSAARSSAVPGPRDPRAEAPRGGTASSQVPRIKRKYTRRCNAARPPGRPGKTETERPPAAAGKSQEVKVLGDAEGSGDGSVMSSSNSRDNGVTSQASRDAEQLPVLERALDSPERECVGGEGSGQPQGEDREMPELTIAAY